MDASRALILTHFDSQDRRAFLATLFRLARADGVSPQERDRLQPVAQWMKADDSELSEAMRLAYDEERSLESLLHRLSHPSKSLLVYRESCAIAWVDGGCSAAEVEFLNGMARIFGLAKDATALLNSPLACSPEGERRFLVLLEGASG